MRTIVKKTPQLRLTGIKEAETEFNLAWYGYLESRELAKNIEAGITKLPTSNREATQKELERFR